MSVKFAVMRSAGVREIVLSNGMVALVDAADYDLVSKYRWHVHKANRHGSVRYYAIREYARTQKPRRIIQMHREILQAPPGSIIDHRDGNGLNNTRANLRYCTTAQNIANQRQHINNTSGFKGVYRHKRAQKWAAQIAPSGQYIHLGLFEDKRQAAQAYNVAALRFFGEFAFLNEVD